MQTKRNVVMWILIVFDLNFRKFNKFIYSTMQNQIKKKRLKIVENTKLHVWFDDEIVCFANIWNQISSQKTNNYFIQKDLNVSIFKRIVIECWI